MVEFFSQPTDDPLMTQFWDKRFWCNKGGRMHFLLKNDDILNYSYATNVHFLQLQCDAKRCTRYFPLLTFEHWTSTSIDYNLDKLGSVILIHVKCYLWNVMHKTNSLSNNVWLLIWNTLDIFCKILQGVHFFRISLL